MGDAPQVSPQEGLSTLLQGMGVPKWIASLAVAALLALGAASNARLDSMAEAMLRMEKRIEALPSQADLLVRDERYRSLEQRLNRLEKIKLAQR